METITAKDFLENTLNLDMFSDDEIDTLVTTMNLFAKGKCKEQRELCNFHATIIMNNAADIGKVFIQESSILNAPEPEFN